MAAMTGSQPLLGGGASLATGSALPFAASLVTAAGTALAQHGGARLLASPNFARRLANTPPNAHAAARYWSSPWVAQMARSQPAIANDLTGFQQAMLQQFGGGTVARVAASPDPNNEDERYRR
jgi:hypothetical protein